MVRMMSKRLTYEDARSRIVRLHRGEWRQMDAEWLLDVAEAALEVWAAYDHGPSVFEPVGHLRAALDGERPLRIETNLRSHTDGLG
jgi:hypothetical protein